ncbi:MAG: hypothetical protein ABIA04_06215 [Pseudomonadota bacterium]
MKFLTKHNYLFSCKYIRFALLFLILFILNFSSIFANFLSHYEEQNAACDFGKKGLEKFYKVSNSGKYHLTYWKTISQHDLSAYLIKADFNKDENWDKCIKPGLAYLYLDAWLWQVYLENKASENPENSTYKKQARQNEEGLKYYVTPLFYNAFHEKDGHLLKVSEIKQSEINIPNSMETSVTNRILNMSDELTEIDLVLMDACEALSTCTDLVSFFKANHQVILKPEESKQHLPEYDPLGLDHEKELMTTIEDSNEEDIYGIQIEKVNTNNSEEILEKKAEAKPIENTQAAEQKHFEDTINLADSSLHLEISDESYFYTSQLMLNWIRAYNPEMALAFIDIVSLVKNYSDDKINHPKNAFLALLLYNKTPLDLEEVCLEKNLNIYDCTYTFLAAWDLKYIYANNFINNDPGFNREEILFTFNRKIVLTWLGLCSEINENLAVAITENLSLLTDSFYDFASQDLRGESCNNYMEIAKLKIHFNAIHRWNEKEFIQEVYIAGYNPHKDYNQDYTRQRIVDKKDDKKVVIIENQPVSTPEETNSSDSDIEKIRLWLKEYGSYNPELKETILRASGEFTKTNNLMEYVADEGDGFIRLNDDFYAYLVAEDIEIEKLNTQGKDQYHKITAQTIYDKFVSYYLF